MIQVAVANEQMERTVNDEQLREAVARVLQAHEIPAATISVAVVDHPLMRQLNKQFLEHDYDTDVLSFLLEDGPDGLDGEIIVNIEMADEQAARYGWPTTAELLLYTIHGTLHLVGYDDSTPEAALEMRTAEQRFLKEFGWEPRPEQSSTAGDQPQ